MEDSRQEEEERGKLKGSAESADSASILHFGRAIRKRNSCPLCNFVQSEIEKGHGFPVEEWIFLSHLRAAHKLEP